MLMAKRTSQFKKDFKRYLKSGKHNIDKLKKVMLDILNERPLLKDCHNHPLKGAYSDFSECHIEPDWLLIYKIERDLVIFVRTGSHSELFK